MADSRNHLVLNAVPIQFDEAAVLRVGRQPYVDHDHLSELRSVHRGSHLVRRAGDLIEVVAVDGTSEPFGDQVDVVPLGEARGLLCALYLDALLRHLLGLGRDVRRHRPLTLVSSRPEDNVLLDAVPRNVNVPRWLSCWVVYEFDTRLLHRDQEEPAVLLACGVQTSTIIDGTCDDLLHAGVDLVGRYVQIVHEGDDPRLVERRRLVGRVADVRQGQLVLEDHVEGHATVPLGDAYLEPRSENVEACLRALVGRRADGVMERLRQASGEVAGGPSRFERANKLFNYLRGLRLEIAPGVPVSLGQTISADEAEFPPYEVVQRPTLIFDPSGRRTHRWAQGGLDQHGPYDRTYFPKKRPRVAVICQARHQGRVEQFVETFLEGLKEGPYERGLMRRFALERPEVQFFRTRAPTAAGYTSACEEALVSAEDRGTSWDLALVQIEDRFKALPPDRNPYLTTKALLYRHQIAVQEITLRTVRLRGGQLGYALNNMSLATYAKLGGVPWVLPADRTVAHELVIGLGSFQASGSRLGGRERYVGLTTVFTGDGRYLLDGSTKAVPFEGYTEAMLDVLQHAVEQVREEQNWRETDPVRLVFHAFKPLRSSEVDAVKEVMSNLGLPHAEFAFLHLVGDHPFTVFDLTEDGANAPGGGKKGRMAPPRGLHLRLSQGESLMAFKGAREVKRPSDGLPRPVLLRLHRDSTFADLTYLSRQAFTFSCHSWRTFFPAPMPITIMYSGLIARLLGQLQQVPGWAADSMWGRIGRTRWFL